MRALQKICSLRSDTLRIGLRVRQRFAMDSDEGMEVVRDENSIECEVCYNNYNETTRRPKSLPCGHTFCCLCLTTDFVNGRRKCPTCRKPHRARSILNLPVNVALETVIRNLKESKKKSSRF